MTANPTEVTTIPPLSFSNSILRGFERLKFTPLLTFVVVLVLNAITNIGSALYFNAWGAVQLPSGVISPGLSHEPASWMVFALAQPLVFATAVWLQTSADKMIKCLIGQGAVRPTEEIHDALVWGSRKLRSRLLFATAWAMGFLLQIFVVLLEYGIIGIHTPTWLSVHPVVFWSRAIMGVVAYYLLSVVVLCLAVILMTLSRVMQTADSVRVRVYHPDEAGGLGSIGQFVANLGYLAFIFGAAIAVLFWQAMIFSGHNTGWFIGALISSVAYVIIAPLFFFLPLLSTHQAMVRYRSNLLQKISAEINDIYHSALQSKYVKARNCLTPASIGDTPLSGHKEDASEDVFTCIKQLNELREHTMQFPIWPFSFAHLRKYYVLAASPIITFLVGLANDWASRRILGP